jgi:hypothetical protein
MRDIAIRIIERAPEITIVKFAAMALIGILCLILGIR